MKTAEPLIFSTLLALTLGGAYVVYQEQGDAPVAAGEVVILAPTGASAVTALLWEGPKSSARVEARGEKEVPWVTWNFNPDLTIPEDSNEDEPEAHDHDHDHQSEPARDQVDVALLTGEAPVMAQRLFPGNKEAESLLAFYAPLKGVRRFDNLSEVALGEMGLLEPEETLTVFHGESAHIFEVGSGAYGSDHVYLRAKGGGPTFLVKSQGIRPLRRAPTRLMERDALGVELREVGEVRITRPGGEALRGIYRGGRDQASAFWALASSPDENESRLGAFVGALMKARVASYPIEGEAAPVVEERAKVTFFDEGGQELGGAALAWGEGEEGGGFIWSPRTGRWVPLLGAAGIDLADTLRDLDALAL